MKKLLLIVLAIVLVALLLWSLVLIPAHWQIRSVTPALPSAAELRSLLTADNTPVRVSYINTSAQTSPRGRIALAAIVIEWANGDLFMIDAGMDQAGAAEFGKLLEFMWSAQPAQPQADVAQRLGSNAQRIKGLGFTHLHIDHTQGVENLCKVRDAPIPLYQTHYQRTLRNLHTREGARLTTSDCFTAQVVHADGLNPLPGFPGLGIVPLGGHTPGSTLFAVAVNGKILLFSGDITNSRADLLADKSKPFWYSNFLLPEYAKRTAVLRRWLRELDNAEDITVVVAHDLDNIQNAMPDFMQAF